MKAIIGTEESLKLVVGSNTLKDGEWQKHNKQLWIFKLSNEKKLAWSEFPPDVQTVIICEFVSLRY